MVDHDSSLFLGDVFSAIDMCRERKLSTPLLVLVYSAIDTLAWTVYGENMNEVKMRFLEFCERYLLPNERIPCTALELYAARCAVIHSLGWESKLTTDGHARSLFYSFGMNDLKVAQEAYDLLRPGQFIGISADELIAVTRRANHSLSKEAESDIGLRDRMDFVRGKQYMHLQQHESELLYSSFIKAKRRERE